ncbi:MAG: Xaa-Pro peptidase family protein [Sulfolobaceae archaeon]
MERIKKLLKHIDLGTNECIIIFGVPNIFYFTNYYGPGALIHCNENSILVVPLLEKYRAESNAYKSIEVVAYYPFKIQDGVIEGNLLTSIQKIIGNNRKRVLVDKEWMSIPQLEMLKAYEIEDISKEIWKIRSIKTSDEIENIIKAGDITKKAMEKAMEAYYSSEKLSEKELAGIIDYYMKKYGAEDYAFPSIVAFGKNSAEPHHVPSDVKLSENDIMLIDIGAKYSGYCFDSTRTLIGKVKDQEIKKVYEAVLEAQLTSIDNVHDGVLASELDTLSRKILDKYDLSRNFIHSLGHGVGIEIHEFPTLSQLSKDVRLEKNMVITIEPGVYFKDKYGIRIEDTIIVTSDKAKVIETLPK